MNKILSALLITVFISGCAAGPEPSAVPVNYKGPLSSIKDSFKQYDATKADFFYLSQVDKKDIPNSRFKTLENNRGQGMQMKAAPVVRNVPSKTATFHIVGRTEYAAPILALANPVYQVQGDISFRPKPNVQYVVAGSLSPTYSAVWIEEAATKKLIGNKIVINGSAALGFFQK